MSIESYASLSRDNPEGFKLMKNSANALFLNFNPLIYDLTIPRPGDIKRMLNIYQANLNGKAISSEEVNCCYPWYSERNIELNLGDRRFDRIERGLEFCFNTQDKYDSLPIFVYLTFNEEIFGKEIIKGNSLYRLRDGKRDLLKEEVGNYFNKPELDKFKEISEFMQPYLFNLDKPAKIKFG